MFLDLFGVEIFVGAVWIMFGDSDSMEKLTRLNELRRRSSNSSQQKVDEVPEEQHRRPTNSGQVGVRERKVKRGNV